MIRASARRSPLRQPGQVGRQLGRDVEVRLADHVVDHALQAHAPAVFRRIDAADAVGLQLGDLLAAR